MPFILAPKKTTKYNSYNGWRDGKYGSETDYPSQADILNTNGFSPSLWSIRQHGDYYMGMLYETDYEQYGDCIEDAEMPGQCLYNAKKVNQRISFPLYKRKGDVYEEVSSSSSTNIDSSDSINDWGVIELLVDTKQNAIAAITPPNTTSIHLKKFNKKGKLVWSNSALPGIPMDQSAKAVVYDLIADTSGGIIAIYGYKEKPDAIFLTKFSRKDGSPGWSSTPLAEHFEQSDNYYGYTRISRENSLLLTGKDSLLIVANGTFPDSFSGTRVIQAETSSGSIIDSKNIDTDTDFSVSEIFAQENTAYLRTGKGAYSLGKINPAETQSDVTTKEDFKVVGDPLTIKNPSKFKVKYIDKIVNFSPSTDTLEIDTDSFGLESSATFAAGKNRNVVKKQLAKLDIDFLYNQKKGGLYFNENGSDKGFGDGGIIAILKGAHDLTANNLEFI